MIQRDECLKVLAEFHSNEIVVPVYQVAFEWRIIKPHPLTYLCVGAMGQASSHGLGLALGNQDRQIIVLDGDGSLLMNLGSLVTIAEAAPANLIHFVFENGTYESNGSHPIPGQNRVDFAGIARAAGYKEAFTFSEINSFKNDMPDILNKTGPVFIDLKVCSGPQYPQAYDVIHSRTVREEFKKALNT